MKHVFPPASPIIPNPTSILDTYDQVLAAAQLHVVGRALTPADLSGLRRRVATMHGVSVEVVADATARRSHAQRLAVANAAARPRHPVTKGIE